jgi:hypothetical protein
VRSYVYIHKRLQWESGRCNNIDGQVLSFVMCICSKRHTLFFLELNTPQVPIIV